MTTKTTTRAITTICNNTHADCCFNVSHTHTNANTLCFYCINRLSLAPCSRFHWLSIFECHVKHVRMYCYDRPSECLCLRVCVCVFVRLTGLMAYKLYIKYNTAYSPFILHSTHMYVK